MAFGLLFFKNKYDDSHKGIHFIQKLTLNSNPTSDIYKNIKKKPNKNSQTEFDMPTL
jgi:hypothetical protein